MKKKILIITSVIVLILAVIASIIFIPKMINKNDIPEKEAEGKSGRAEKVRAADAHLADFR